MLIANLLGITAFLFLIWKRLKEDYSYERVFNFGMITIFLLIIGSFLSNYFVANFWFWVEILALAIAIAISFFKLYFKFYETFDSLVIGLLAWQSFYFLVKAIVNLQLFSFLIFWISVACFFLFWFFEAKYKSFSWYKSGKKGFSGLLTASIFFLARAGLYYQNLLEVVLSIAFAFVFFLLLYKLSYDN